MLYVQDKVQGIVQESILRRPNCPSFSVSLHGVRTGVTAGAGGPGEASGKEEPSEQAGGCRTLMVKRLGEQGQVGGLEVGIQASW